MIRPRIKQFFRIALRRDDIVVRNVDDEIRAHLDMRTEQLVREGLTPERAREEAIRRFGSMDDARRDLQQHAHQRERTMQLREWLDALRQDIRYAARGLRREPLFAGFVIATLALGIGANAAMFGVVDRMLLRGPEHITDASRLMRVYLHERVPGQGEFATPTFGYVMYSTLKNNTHSFDGVAAYVATPHGQTVLGHGTDAQLIQQGQATADLFPVLGVKPALGRFFSPDEDNVVGAERVAVLGYGLWQRVYAGDPNILGKTILLRDIPYAVVGVAPKGFTGPQLNRVDVWVPMSLHVSLQTPDWSHTWSAQWLMVVSRLKPGVTRTQAAEDATAAYRHAYTGGDKDDAGADLLVAPLTFSEDGKESTEVTVSRWFVGVAFVVLLIACSNVVNLLLARAVRRRREVAVRLALGAARRRLVQLLLTESLMLAALGGAAGLAVAWVTATLMRTVLLNNVEWTSSAIDARVLVVSAAIALGVGVITGLVPALRSSRPDLTSSLKSGVREGGAHGTRLRAALTVAQAALSIVLLVGAGLFVRSLTNVRGLDLGMQPARFLVVSPRWPSISSLDSARQVTERARRENVLAQVLDKTRQLPGIERAAMTIGLPFRSGYQQFLRVPGWDSIPKVGGAASVSAASGDYFETVGTRVLNGRAFTSADHAGTEPVTVVSELMAKTLWPKGDAIGQCLFTGPKKDSLNICSRVVGVAADVHRFRLNEKASMHYYVPFGQERGMGGTDLLVRPRNDPQAAIPEIRKLFQQLDPTIVYVDANTLQDEVDPQVRPWRLGASVFGLMGILALLVAAVGLYSVMSYLVAQRTHELGVRIALGASGGNILSLVLKSSVGMALLGIVIGLAMTLVAGRFIQPLLFNTSSRDSSVLGGVALAMLAVALLASALPALRARGTDPMEALRTE
ncbi:MAG TPA: ADOP family duplicated permease [Gemmatimonadaceae bacterium]|nr:ADOP family duplicated permease [Gemmatimonadaceae bacterium]